MPEPVFLVCAPAEAPLVVPGSIFSRQCCHCQRRVMIAPSGQGFLKDHPTAQIICKFCFYRLDGEMKTQLARSRAEIAREQRSAVPNLWKYRN